MYKIAVDHPISLREFTSRAHAVQMAAAWGLAPFRVYLNFTHPGRGVNRVPAAQ